MPTHATSCHVTPKRHIIVLSEIVPLCPLINQEQIVEGRNVVTRTRIEIATMAIQDHSRAIRRHIRPAIVYQTTYKAHMDSPHVQDADIDDIEVATYDLLLCDTRQPATRDEDRAWVLHACDRAVTLWLAERRRTGEPCDPDILTRMDDGPDAY